MTLLQDLTCLQCSVTVLMGTKRPCSL